MPRPPSDYAQTGPGAYSAFFDPQQQDALALQGGLAGLMPAMAAPAPNPLATTVPQIQTQPATSQVSGFGGLYPPNGVYATSPTAPKTGS